MRESDPDATIYWLVRMLEAGEDPLYVARRIVRFASEDVGLADPRRSARGARREGGLRLPRDAGGVAGARGGGRLLRARAEVERPLRGRERGQDATSPRSPPSRCPAVIRNAVTKLMKAGRATAAATATRTPSPRASAGSSACRTASRGRRYYRPRASGEEAELAKRLEAVLKLRQEKWAKEAEAKREAEEGAVLRRAAAIHVSDVVPPAGSSALPW